MKYKLIVKTSHKHYVRKDNCLSTWLEGEDYVFLTDKLVGIGNEISMSSSDEYKSNEEKTVNFINHVRTSEIYDEYDWLIFIDDDAIYNKKHFEYFLPFLNKEKAYGLIMSAYSKIPNLKYLSGGAGYLLSPSLIKKSKEISIQNTGFEDVCMGIWYKENNIELADSCFINETKCPLNFNGWFPIDGEYSNVNNFGESYVSELIEKIKNNDEINNKLVNHSTHHYIRHKSLMKYIFEKFQEWEIDE